MKPTKPVPCSRCADLATAVALVWSDALDPAPICCDCAQDLAMLLSSPNRGKLGQISVDWLPLLALPEIELH